MILRVYKSKDGGATFERKALLIGKVDIEIEIDAANSLVHFGVDGGNEIGWATVGIEDVMTALAAWKAAKL